MTVRVGIIGTGMIGQDHARRITEIVAGATVSGVADVDPARAQGLADLLPDARAFEDGHALITSDEVDAVVVTSWGATHAEYVLAAIAAGKPVFCEKPLATTEEDCLAIVDAEAATGRRLVQVGFMRRYDAAYRALKRTIENGSVGDPLLMHCAHRPSTVAATFTDEMMINDVLIHEIDATRWLTGEEIVEVLIRTPRRNVRVREDLADPVLASFTTESGIIVEVEASANIGSGYEIRAEVVGNAGIAHLDDPATARWTAEGQHRVAVSTDWRERFVDAYDREFQEWTALIGAGEEPTGPSAWDGYAATAVSDAAVRSLTSGQTVPVRLRAS